MQLSTRATLLFAVICTILGATLALGQSWGADAAPSPSMLSQSDPSTCDVSIAASVEPKEVILGDVVDVMIRASSLCRGEIPPLHVALVLDGSGSMTAESLDVMKSSAKDVVAKLLSGDRPNTKVSVVEYAERATIRCELTADVSEIETCIDAVGADGPTAMDKGIKQGVHTLTKGRSGITRTEELMEVLVVFSDGKNITGCEPVEEEAIRAKEQGILVVTFCVGDDCDSDCLRRVAPSERYTFDPDSIEELFRIIGYIMNPDSWVNLKQLTVSEEFVENMLYIPDSAVPAPIAEPIGLGRLDWQFSLVPRTGITMTWKVRPTEIGTHAVSAGAVGTFRDSRNRGGEISAASVSVNVVAPPLEWVFVPYAENP